MAQEKGKFKISYVGTGTPPAYAYVLLTSTVTYDEDANCGASFSLGLPDITAPTPPGLIQKAKTKHGRKIAKLSLTNGVAEFETTANVNLWASATAVAPASNQGTAGTEADLVFKALGLNLNIQTYKREHYTVGTHDSYRQAPASTGDFENEEAEIGVTVQTQTVPTFDPFPGNEVIVSGANYNLTVPIMRLGDWDTYFGSHSSSVDIGYRYEWVTIGGVWTGLNCFGSFSTSELEQMRRTPKELLVKGQQQDPGSTVPGPMKGNLKVKLWAPERLLDKEETSYHEIEQLPIIADTPGGGAVMWGFVKKGTKGSVTYRILTTTSQEFSGEVSLTGGSTGPENSPIRAFGVKADAGVKLGAKWGKTYSGGSEWTSPHNMPSDTWVRFIVDWEKYDMPRHLAIYDSNGYQVDTFSKIVNWKKPNGIGYWDEKNVPPVF